MNTVLYKEQLSQDVFLMRLYAPLIARERQPGQFIILQTDNEFGERIPLTIADANTHEGTITIIFQVVGKTTKQLSTFNTGNRLPVLVGPLGRPTHIQNFGRVVCVCGGIGIAPMHPIAQALKNSGNHVTVIMGAKTKALLILEKEMEAIADELIICTDDGTYGTKALVTAPLKALCEQEPKPNMVIAIGPPVMMKYCAATTKPYNIFTQVSLNTIMLDGTGMCGGCRVNVGKEIKFVCVDGPEFDGHLVDFDNMIARLNAYKTIESKNYKCFVEKAFANPVKNILV